MRPEWPFQRKQARCVRSRSWQDFIRPFRRHPPNRCPLGSGAMSSWSPACVTKVEQLGGQVVIPPQVLPGGDEMAVVLDTEGLSLGVMKTRAAAA